MGAEGDPDEQKNTVETKRTLKKQERGDRLLLEANCGKMHFTPTGHEMRAQTCTRGGGGAGQM